MKRLKVWLILTFCIGLLSVAVKSQTELQSRFDLLVPRLTNLEQIEKIFGKPDSQKKLTEWYGKIRKNGGFAGYDMICNTFGRVVKRKVYELNYPNSGLKIFMLDNPWNLYSVEVINPEISVLNSLKVGDSLEKTQKTLGKGDWYTTKSSDVWTLEYDKKGIKFIFLKDKSNNQHPRKRVKEAIVSRIEVFDKDTYFAGCSEEYFNSL